MGSLSRRSAALHCYLRFSCRAARILKSGKCCRGPAPGKALRRISGFAFRSRCRGASPDTPSSPVVARPIEPGEVGATGVSPLQRFHRLLRRAARIVLPNKFGCGFAAQRTSILLCIMLIGSPARGQDAEPVNQETFTSAFPVGSDGLSDLDIGQEAPGPPMTPGPQFGLYTYRYPSNRFFFGDWFGLRPWLEERGFTFYVSSTQFEQGVASGGVQQAFRWGSKFDMLAHLDSHNLGLWDGGTLDMFVESRLGQDPNGYAGSLSPVNLSMYFPVPYEQVTAITGLKYTQEITDRFGIYFGKLNALNGEPDRFLKYPLTSRFMNAAFNFNLALDRFPYSTPGAGFYWKGENGPSLDFMVLNTYSSPLTSGFEDLGRNGVFLYGAVKQATEFFALPGKHTFAGLFGTGKFTELAPAPFVELPYVPFVAPRKTGTWTLLWNFEQRLYVNPDNPDIGLGLYVQTGLGDGNPNPVRWFVSTSVCGNSSLVGREGDTFGVGFYEVGLSDQAKSLGLGLRDETGVELFYNFRITNGCHLTPDFQVIHPGLAPVNTAVVVGLRLKIDF